MDYNERHKAILEPCVRVRDGSAGGSGTVIYSGEKNGEYSTYILTNHHVVDGLIKVDKKWSTLLQRERKADVFGIPDVEFFNWRWKSRTVGAQSIECDIMTYDKDEDLALLKLRSDEPVRSVAKLYPRGKENDLRITMPVFAVGAAMGEPPVTTGGFLSQFGREIEQKEYWLTTANSIYGNSGGAVFLQESYEFIGVPARIAVRGGMFGSDAITHLSYIVPITRVYQFLEDQMFRFIYDSKYTEESEFGERERRRKEEERKIAEAEDKGEEVPEEEPDSSDGGSDTTPSNIATSWVVGEQLPNGSYYMRLT